MGAERTDAQTEPEADGRERLTDDPLQQLSDELRTEMQWSAAQLQERANAAQARVAQAQADATAAQAAAYAAQQRAATRMPLKPPPGRWEMYPAPAYLEELQQAVDSGLVSFSQTFLALQIGTDLRGPESVTSKVLNMESALMRAFQVKYGGILESRYAEAAAAGVVLLRRVDEADDAPAPTAGTAEATGTAKATAPPETEERAKTEKQATTEKQAKKEAADEQPPRRAIHRVIGTSIARFVRRVFTGSPDPASTDSAHTPRAGDMDALVMWHWLNFDSQDATNMLSSVLALRDRITTFLRGDLPREKDARDIALRRLYAIARELMSAVDREEHLKQIEMQPGRQPDRRPSGDLSPIIKDLKARMATTESSYLGSVQRVAQNEYLIGMANGLVIGAVALIGLAVVTDLVGFTAAWLAASIGGVIGATLSVLQRMSRGLDLGPEGEKQSFRQQGLARPLIGFLLGLASYVLLKGGIVSFTTPSSSSNQVLYYAGIAFLAGFSERFAQDMLVAPTRTDATPASTTPPKPG